MVPFRASLVALYLIAAWMLAALPLLIASPSPFVISILALAIFLGLLSQFPRADGHEFTPRESWIVCGMAACAAVFGLLVHRPDGDDGGYFSQSVYFSNHFFESSPLHWTIFPNQDAPLPYPLYRFSAFYYLVGLLSLSFEPLDVVAFFLAPAGSALCVFAYALLFKACFPKSWVIGLGCYLLFLAVDASSPALPSQFSFVRIWQGKSLLLNFGIPFFTYLLVRRNRTSPKTFLIVGAGLMGLSPMALFMMGITLLVPLSLEKFRQGLPSLVVPLGLTLANARNQFDSVNQSFSSPRLSEIALWFFGTERSMIFWLSTFLLALAFGPQRRLILGSLAAVLAMFNPLASDYVARFVTSSLVFWRILWLCPFAIAVGSITDVVAKKSRLAATFITLILIALPSKYSWENASYAELRLPSRKVPRAAQSAVDLVHTKLSDGATILAPHDVSSVLLASKREIYSLTPRSWYVFRVFDQGLGRHEEFKDREYALQALEGGVDFEAPRMNRVVIDHDIHAVVIPLKSKNAEALNSFFNSQGFENMRIEGDCLSGPYSLWFKK